MQVEDLDLKVFIKLEVFLIHNSQKYIYHINQAAMMQMKLFYEKQGLINIKTKHLILSFSEFHKTCSF